MSKEKIQKCISKNSKLSIAILITLIVLAIIGINVYAGSDDKYAVEVKDDGALNIAQDANSSFTKKIVEDDTKSITYEVKVNNLADSTKIPEVAIVIDSSRSVGKNDLTGDVKAKAIQLVTELLTHSPRTKISISTNSGTKVGMSNSSLSAYTNAIDAITYSDGKSVATGIDTAAGTFSGADTEKYLVIFSDATDSTKIKLEAINDSGIEVYSLLAEITNNEYETSAGSMGSVQMLSDILDFSHIYNKTNVSMLNVKLTDTFSEEANKYFDFEILSKEDDVEIEKTPTGYILKCDDIKVGESRTLKYKLTLKDTKVDARKIYTILNSSSSINLEYEDSENQAKTYNMENSPTFVICKKYSLTIEAVSEKSDDLPITGLDVQVIGTVTDSLGNVETILNETLTTDSKGKILIDGLKTLGDITFEIKPLVNHFGYVETSATQIIVHNDPEGIGTIWAEADVGEKPEVDPVERNITVKLPILVETFDLEIITTDANNSHVSLGNIEYRLIQPKLNSLYDMEAIYGVTDADGKVTLKPTMMTKDGSYQYILSQMNEQDGYDPMGNVTLIVTFEGGKVTAISAKYNELVSAKLDTSTENKGIVTVGNIALIDDTFDIELNLKDAINSEPLFGAKYTIEVERTGSSSELVTKLTDYVTDLNGQINVTVPGSGYVRIKVTEVAPKAGYAVDPDTKEIVIDRRDGTVKGKLLDPYNVAEPDPDNNRVIINLTSKTANEKNQIKVHLLDYLESDVGVQRAVLEINKVGETTTTQGTTDRDGIAKFLLNDQPQGEYEYEIRLVGDVPNGYIVSSPLLAKVKVYYGANKHIQRAEVVSYNVPEAHAEYEYETEDTYVINNAKVELKLEPDPTSLSTLKIKLLNGVDMTTGLAGGKYSIQILSDGEEVKYLANKITDGSGEYTTRIIGGGNNIEIRITQTETRKGFIKTPDTQVIELELGASGYELKNSAPYTYDPANGNYRGAEQNGNEIIYHDINEGKTGANTIVNLFINEVDQNDFLVPGVKVKLSSDTLKDANGNALDYSYDSTDAYGNPINKNYYESDEHGYFEVLGIRVEGDKLTNGERVDYLHMVELDEDGNEKSNTKITFKLTFRANNITGVVEVTNVEATWGNRLLKEKTFSARESDVAYENDIHLDLITNYDDVGNFALDLKKINKDGNTLIGAKYDIVVIRPDSTRLIRRDIEVTDKVELQGILVSKGTKIEITEKEAPIGYNLNAYTEVITITEVNEITGVVKYELEESAYSTPRAEITNEQVLVSSDGSYKIQVTVSLTDYEMDTFKFGIIAQDKVTSNPIKDYSFTISTSEGAHKNTSGTDENGKTSINIGANYKIDNYEVTYTIDSLKVADYYKKLESPIEVKVVFDINGDVLSGLTDAANLSQPGYKDIWDIVATNTIDGNNIDISIKIDPCDPLVVNIQTVDTLNNSELTNVEYAIIPTLNLPATGTTKVDVGYVLPGGMQTYTIKQTNADAIENYQPIADQQIKITYDEEGNIEALDEVTGSVHEVSISGKEATIIIDIEPRVPFVITNTGYFDGKTLIDGKFEISLSETDSRKIVTGMDGQAITYIGAFGTSTSAVYTVKQTGAAYGYATVDDFQIEVFFDENRNIVDAKLLGDVNKYVDFVQVTHKVPSVSGDTGYNGNDNGIINISVKNYPEVQFKIENVDRRDNNIKLAGATYKIESSIQTKDELIVVDPTGMGIANLDKSGYETVVTYTITELSPSPRYQSLGIDAVVQVTFDNLGYVSGTPVVLKRTDVVTASTPVIVDVEDNFKINLVIESNPALSVTVTKVDEEDPTILIPNVDFELTARIVKDNLTEYSEEEIEKLTLNSAEVTEENYLSQVIDRLKINTDIVEEMKKQIAIENFIEELKDNDNLTAEEEDEINAGVNNNIKINTIISLGKATKTQMNQRVAAITNRQIVDKLIDNGTTTEDRVNELLEIVKNLVRLDVDNITTDANGIAIAYMDRTLANKTIEYTLKETKKADGYDWLDEVVIFEVTYDAEGKMIASNPVKEVSGSIDITKIDQEDFAIEATVKNKPSDEVRIHLSVEDVYDSNKKLESAIFDAYLVDTENTITFSPDDKYRTTLESGSEIGTTGLTTAHGEDTESIGIYEDGATKQNRILRLVLKQTPTSYYIGDKKFESAYQPIKYALLVNVQFNDEGSVTGVSLYHPGGDSNSIGYIADDRYIQVSHTRNTINVTVRFYPMIQVRMQTVDMYTGDTLEGNYTIDTRMWGSGMTGQSEAISSGYINPYHSWSSSYFGRTYSANYITDSTITTIEEAARVALAPTEADVFPENKVPDTFERTFLIYENQEPTSPTQYQKYRARYLTHSSQYLIAKVHVTYDTLGQVVDVKVEEEISRNNIQSGYTKTVKAELNEHTIDITLEYAPITKITATVIDDITGAVLPGVRINPYLDGNEVTKTSYEYRTSLYYTTGKTGTAGWTYWGASIPNSQNRYVLDSYTSGSGYEGYCDPGNIILDVAYGENGRVSDVTSRNTDAFGDDNTLNITWDEYNNINVTIRYCRKFIVQLNKVDYYDRNTILDATFAVTTSKGATATAFANKTAALGKIYPGKTITYTVSETVVPKGYLPITNMNLTVEFYNNGAIKNVTSSNEDYFELLEIAPVDEDTCDVGKIDLRANIKNKPRFDVAIQLSDEFYPELKLEGATFEITNDKGDVDAGGVMTDENGLLTTYVGTTYVDEYVTYTIKQTNVISGYYENKTIAQFKVHFNENGKLDEYTLLSGNDIATIDPTKHIGGKSIQVNITNMPKDIRVGLYKYDELTEEVMSDVRFTVKTEVVGGATTEKQIITNADGTVSEVIDTFVETTSNRIVNYTISEIEAAETYRKIQDVVLQITYNEDGSIYYHNVLSNPSNVGVEVAINKQIRRLNETEDNTPVHIKLTVPNDNAYDLIVKDEDKKYAGLGIEGTTYDVTINGVAQQPLITDANGLAYIKDQTQSGNIEIVITERQIGEGYRADNNNSVTLKVEKGIEEYTLVLNDNSNPTYANVVVDEEYGTITVTFKNETKLELTMQKEDINEGDVLRDAVFEILEREIDSLGNVVTGTERVITTDSNNTTDLNGLLYFDLGLSHQNKIMQYVFTETTAPQGYDAIEPITVTVKFDAYGHILEMSDDSFRAEELLASETGKSHHMIVIIGNGTVNDGYTVKIVTEDSQSGRRINGSIFQVEAIVDETGSTDTSVTGVTKDITKEVAGHTIISDEGALAIEGITAEGNVSIKFKQIETATGYIHGTNVTSGVVKLNAKFEVVPGRLEKNVVLTSLDNGGFNVRIDNTNREITIKVLNDPQVIFEITKNIKNTDVVLEGVKFNITATKVELAGGAVTDLGLNIEPRTTNENGYTEADVGYAYAGNIVIYTISEETMPGFKELEDVQIAVQYDADGNIVEYKVLSNLDDVTILPDASKEIKKRTLKDKLPGIVEIEEDEIEIPTGTGSRILQMHIHNQTLDGDTEFVKPGEFGFSIISVDEDMNQTMSGPAKFTLVNELTGDTIEFETDTFGRANLISMTMPEEPGMYKYCLTEIQAPAGYKLETEPMYIELLFVKDGDEIYLSSVNTVGTRLVHSNPPAAGELPNTKIQLKVVHEEIDYTIKVLKHHENDPDYPYGIEGVEFEIKVTQEYGEELSWRDITDENGEITSNKINGYGYITIEIKEIAAPDKYQVDYETKTGVFYRDKYTKQFTQVHCDVAYDFDEANQIIYLIPVNELAGGIYDMVINKVDSETDTLITNNPAIFNLNMIRDYYTMEEVVNPETGEVTLETKVTKVKEPIFENLTTDEMGILIKESASMPDEAGTYTFELEEVTPPEGYFGLPEVAEFTITFEKNENEDLIITDLTVTKQSENVIKLVQKDQFINLVVKNTPDGSGDDEPVLDGKVVIDITKVNKEDEAITTDTAIFKLTNNTTGEIQYVETNELGNVLIDIKDSEEAGEFAYTLNEVKAPEGYALNREDIKIKLTYEADDETGKIYLSDIKVDGEHVSFEEVSSEEVPNRTIKLRVMNEEGTYGSANDKPYTVIINKIDADTKELITKDHATFEVSLVNGEIIHAASNKDGQVIIENVYMPSQADEYEIIIEELEAPQNYELDSEMKIVKVVFNGSGEDMVISNVQLDGTYNKNIEIVEYTEDKIVLNVLNESNGLYVISKMNEAGEDIYDVLNSYTGSQYSIDNPFIDTRIAKYGNNVTVQEFIDNLESNGIMTVWDKDGNQISPTDKVKTGMTLKATKGSQELTFTIVVKGDCDGDGRVRTKDLNALVDHISKGKVITDPIALRALDLMVNGGDGRIRTTDLNEFYNIIARG